MLDSLHDTHIGFGLGLGPTIMEVSGRPVEVWRFLTEKGSIVLEHECRWLLVQGRRYSFAAFPLVLRENARLFEAFDGRALKNTHEWTVGTSRVVVERVEVREYGHHTRLAGLVTFDREERFLLLDELKLPRHFPEGQSFGVLAHIH